MNGKVKLYKSDKGYGFITMNNGAGDVFYHINNVAGKKVLEAGQAVEFEITETPKGKSAINVQPV